MPEPGHRLKPSKRRKAKLRRASLPAIAGRNPFRLTEVNAVHPRLSPREKTHSLNQDRDRIGGGGYGDVYALGNTACVKIARRGGDAAYREAYFLALLHTHPGVVQFHGINVTNTGDLAITMERCSKTLRELIHGDLHDLIDDRLIRQLILSLDHMHRTGVVHGDIKPDNIMISSCGMLKLIDFGLSCYSECSRRNQGTPTYIHEDLHGEKQDVYSAGLTLREVFMPRNNRRFIYPMRAHIYHLLKSMTELNSSVLSRRKHLKVTAAELVKSLGEHPLPLNPLVVDRHPLEVAPGVLAQYDLSPEPYPAFFNEFLQANLSYLHQVLATVSMLFWRQPEPKRGFMGLKSKRSVENEQARIIRSLPSYPSFFREFVAYVYDYVDGHTTAPILPELTTLG